jgi:hypothetical protein
MKLKVELKKGHPLRKMNIGKHTIEELKPREIDFSKEEMPILQTVEVKHWFKLTEVKANKKDLLE